MSAYFLVSLQAQIRNENECKNNQHSRYTNPSHTAGPFVARNPYVVFTFG
jgi:hypothetical protein